MVNPSKSRSSSRHFGGFLKSTPLQPLRQTKAQLAPWYQSALGRSILLAEQQWLTQELRCLFGYHLMVLSSAPSELLEIDSPINHTFRLSPTFDHPASSQAVTDYEQLPLADESIDVTVLHHVLEYAVHPQQVLKEAARVTIANGYIILFTYNPVSLLGMASRVGRIFSSAPQSQRRALASPRLCDWLKFVDCTYAQSQYLSHRLPINNERYLGLKNLKPRWLDSRQIPFGAVYCIVARKDRMGMTPIRPAKEKKSILNAVPIPSQGIAVGRSCAPSQQSSAEILSWPRPLSSQPKS